MANTGYIQPANLLAVGANVTSEERAACENWISGSGSKFENSSDSAYDIYFFRYDLSALPLNCRITKVNIRVHCRTYNFQHYQHIAVRLVRDVGVDNTYQDLGSDSMTVVSWKTNTTFVDRDVSTNNATLLRYLNEYLQDVRSSASNTAFVLRFYGRYFQCDGVGVDFEYEDGSQVYVGAEKVKSAYVGTTPVKEIYVGSNRVF